MTRPAAASSAPRNDRFGVERALPSAKRELTEKVNSGSSVVMSEYMALRDCWTPPGAGLSLGRTHHAEGRGMQGSSRVDYDAIAPLYDSQPHREKSPDPALAAFLAGRSALGTALLLHIACGTGNQLVANRAIAPSASLTSPIRPCIPLFSQLK